MFVVDLKRYNDDEDGLVGPFYMRMDAEDYIAAITDDYEREYAIVRPIRHAPGGELHEKRSEFISESSDEFADADPDEVVKLLEEARKARPTPKAEGGY